MNQRRQATWAAVQTALTNRWAKPYSQDQLAALDELVRSWNTLDELLAAVEHFSRTDPDWPPAPNRLYAEATRRRRDAKMRRERGQLPPCATCPGDGWLPGDGGLVPCPQCRPGTHKMHASGHYLVDAHGGDDTTRAEMGALNANARFGPPVQGPIVRNPNPAATEEASPQ